MNFSFANAPHGLSAVPVSGAFLAEIYVKPVIGTDNSAEVQSRDEDSTRLHLTAGLSGVSTARGSSVTPMSAARHPMIPKASRTRSGSRKANLTH